MKAGTMEGLIGAGINMKLMDTPMRVYKEARRKGDLGAMERAMGYAGDFQDTAYEYREKAEKELRKEMEENKEEQKRKQEEAIEERRETAKETTLAISEEGHKLLQENRPDSDKNSPATEAPDLPAPTDTKSDPKFYSSTGSAVETAPVGMNVSVDV